LQANFHAQAHRHAVRPRATVPRFADVSHWEGEPDWSAYATSGRSNLAVAKLTEGSHLVDAEGAFNRTGLAAQGMFAGLYHFAGSSVAGKIADPVTEANFYLQTVGKFGPKEFPVLDFERTYKMSPAKQVAWINKWMTTVQAKSGKTPWLYTYDKFLPPLNTTSLHKWPLWLAFVPKNDPDPDPSNPPSTHGWASLMAWQYSDKQTVPGIGKSDDSYLYGDLAAAVRGHHRPWHGSHLRHRSLPHF
jgi:GH25 family lysozyme M1 (1,4-beta-N-acetylmuramidase)